MLMPYRDSPPKFSLSAFSTPYTDRLAIFQPVQVSYRIMFESRSCRTAWNIPGGDILTISYYIACVLSSLSVVIEEVAAIAEWVLI